MTKQHKPMLFVDMDGTLAEWCPCKCLEELFQKGRFRNLLPYNTVKKAVAQIIEEDSAEVFILSAVVNSDYALEEKNQWLDEHLPAIDSYHRIFVPCCSNMSKARFIMDHLCLKDIRGAFLLDDYSKNLQDWTDHGGSAIKLINGINGTKGTWQGSHVSRYITPFKIVVTLRQIMGQDSHKI